MKSVSPEEEARSIYQAARRIAPLDVGISPVIRDIPAVQVGMSSPPNSDCSSSKGTQRRPIEDESLKDDGIWREKKPELSIRRKFQQLQTSLDSFRQDGVLK